VVFTLTLYIPSAAQQRLSLNFTESGSWLVYSSTLEEAHSRGKQTGMDLDRGSSRRATAFSSEIKTKRLQINSKLP